MKGHEDPVPSPAVSRQWIREGASAGERGSMTLETQAQLWGRREMNFCRIETVKGQAWRTVVSAKG